MNVIKNTYSRTERTFLDIADCHYLPECRPKTMRSMETPFSFLLQGPSGMSGKKLIADAKAGPGRFWPADAF